MAQETYKIGPPRYVAAIVESLTPREFRKALSVRLFANYTDFPHYLIDAFNGIGRTTTRKAIDAFNIWRFLGDMLCLYVAFFTAPAPALAFILALAPVVLAWRDGYNDPPNLSGIEAVADAVVLMLFILVSQVVLLMTRSSWMLPGSGLGVGLLICMATVSGWRFAFRMKNQKTVPPESYRSAIIMIGTLGMGFLGLMLANRWIVPGDQGRLFFLLFIPAVLLTMDIRDRSDAIGGMGEKPLMSLFSDPHEYAALVNRLILPRGKKSTFWWSRLAEPLFFVVVAIPIVWAVARVLIGRLPAQNVNWMQVIANSAAYVALLWMWIEVKKFNAKVAQQLQALEKGKTVS